LHDLLHDLQFHCHNLIIHEIKRFPNDETRSNLEDHALTLQGIIDDLRDTVGQLPFVTDEPAWIGDLARADEELQRAIEDSDPRRLKLSARLMNKVLALQPARINTRLTGAARNLQLPTLVETMTTIRQKVSSLEHDRDKLRELEQG